jgi:hypothetical protein
VASPSARDIVFQKGTTARRRRHGGKRRVSSAPVPSQALKPTFVILIPVMPLHDLNTALILTSYRENGSKLKYSCELYGYETWSLTLREVHRLRAVTKNKFIMRSIANRMLCVAGCIHLHTNQWRTLVTSLIKSRVPYKAGNLLVSCMTVSLSRSCAELSEPVGKPHPSRRTDLTQELGNLSWYSYRLRARRPGFCTPQYPDWP